jgi:aspartate aminotransferase
MPNILSNRVQRIKPSPTIAVAEKARQLKSEGKHIINLGIGEPDFDTPEHIKEAAIKALHDGVTKYTPVDGFLRLKQAVAQKFERENNLHYEVGQVIVSSGCKQSFYNMAQALLNSGDEVIIPAPYWVSYPDIILLADATPVFIPTTLSQHFKITGEQLEKAITPKTKLVVLNSPSNPSGMTYTRKELQALAEVLLKHPHVMIVSDDIYEHILWASEPFSNILNVCPELSDRTIIVHGVSKSYAMTGWRIGYAVGPKAVIAAMKNIQSQSTSGANSIAQMATIAALEGDQACLHNMTQAYQHRHEVLFAALTKIPGIACLPSSGTFYSFPDVTDLMNRLGMQSDIVFGEYLLTEAGIAIVPGSAFGADGCIRVSFATDLDTLHEAITRLTELGKAPGPVYV